jgi:intein/homing endonuclease
VSHAWNPETLEFGNPPCYEIEFEDGSVVKCSNHHPFLVDGEWVFAEDLKENMEVETI